MALKSETIDAIAGGYVAAMTSIRGRRVHRLLLRELCRFDHVVLARTPGDGRALLAAGDDGRAALCRTDGRGPVVCIDEWAGPEAPRVTTCYDLKRDSLPIVTREATEASLSDIARTLTISQLDLQGLSGSPLHPLFHAASLDPAAPSRPDVQ